jgi:hypothetical protein
LTRVDCSPLERLPLALLMRQRTAGPPRARLFVVTHRRLKFRTSLFARALAGRAFFEAGLTRVALAARIGVAETEVPRMLDPDHVTKIDRLGEGMRALGRTLVIVDEAAEAA